MSVHDPVWIAEADVFAHCVNGDFYHRTNGKRLREVPLFRHLKCSLVRNADTVSVEEYHGRKSEVSFRSARPWTRGNRSPACELSDLAIVWLYAHRRDIDIRVTFLQAKWSGGAHKCMEQGPPYNEAFQGNSTQWYLLNKRPDIWPSHGNFNPPSDLLKGAALPSVSSFGVFHDLGGHEYNFFYGAADTVICPPPRRATAKASMYCASPHRFVTTGPYLEEKFSPSVRDFISALLCGRVGTPIELESSLSKTERNYRSRVGGWLVSCIQTFNPGAERRRLFQALRRHFDDFTADFAEPVQEGTGVGQFLLIGGGDLDVPQRRLGSLDF